MKLGTARAAPVFMKLSLILSLVLALPAKTYAQTGVDYVGLWVGPEGARIATYGGSAVVLSFKHSSSVTAELAVGPAHEGLPATSKLYVTISVDGGFPQRMALPRGPLKSFTLVSGLSLGPHIVTLRDDNEPRVGSLEVGHLTLDPKGAWLPIEDRRPIIEVIDDSDATGACVLGPQSPATPALITTSAWQSESLSWPSLLEKELTSVGRPAIVVNLSIGGSTTASEANAYALSAPLYDDELFRTYSGQRHAELVLLWGGANDSHFGGDRATGTPVSVADLSPFQRGIFDQITQITTLNPKADMVLMEYAHSIVPDWKPAYLQVKSLFPLSIQKRISFLSVKIPASGEEACAAGPPKGHPNLAVHLTVATQIFEWLIANDLVPQLHP